MYDNTNRGSVWRNEDKTDANPTWADFKGSINIEGVEYFLNGWKRKPDANPKAPPLSFTVQRKDKQPAPEAPKDYAAPQTAPGGDDFDDIPF
jgi:hypothetical protein